MILCGLDAATTSGCAVMDGDRLVAAEAFRSDGEDHAEIFSDFRRWLTDYLKLHKVERMAIEQPLPTDSGYAYGSGTATDVLGTRKVNFRRPVSSMQTFLLLYGLRAHALEVAYGLDIECEEINVATWRGAIYGRSKAPKGTKNRSKWWKVQALERCKLLGWHIESPDAAEAALICDYLRCKLNPRTGGLFA